MQAIDKSIKLDCIHSTYNIPYAELDTLTNKEILHIWSNIKDGSIPRITFDLKHNRINTLLSVDNQVVNYITQQQSSNYFTCKKDAFLYGSGATKGIWTSSKKSKSMPYYHKYMSSEVASTSLMIWLLMDRI